MVVPGWFAGLPAITVLAGVPALFEGQPLAAKAAPSAAPTVWSSRQTVPSGRRALHMPHDHYLLTA
jgi:hypothetical protein